MKLPRWARTLTSVYLAVVAALVGAVLVLSALGSASAALQGLMLALAALTLPVSAGYLFVSFLASVGSSSVGGYYLGALSLAAGAFYLGCVVLALINAALFRWIIRVRVEATAEAGSPSCGVISARVHSRRPQRLRDIPVAGRGGLGQAEILL